MAEGESADRFSNEAFMEEVARYECLYNRQSKDFKDKHKKLNSWKKVAEKFDMSTQECEVKFRKIRTAYGRYLKRLKTIPSGSGRDAVPPEFANLAWLNPHMTHRPSSTNLRSTPSPANDPSSSSPSSDTEDLDDSIQLVSESPVEADCLNGCVDSSDSPETENNEEGSHSKTPKSSRGTRPWSSSNKRNGHDIDKAILNTANSLVEHIKQSSAKRKQPELPEDEDTLFCRSLVPRLKRLAPQSRAYVRLQIEQLLYQTEFSAVHSQPHIAQSAYGHHGNSFDHQPSLSASLGENSSNSRTFYQF